jgi:hypothetical protein
VKRYFFTLIVGALLLALLYWVTVRVALPDPAPIILVIAGLLGLLWYALTNFPGTPID